VLELVRDLGFDFGALGFELSLREPSESDSELESESDLAFFLEAAEDFGAAALAEAPLLAAVGLAEAGAALDAAAGFDFGAVGIELSPSEKSESDSELESELAFFLEFFLEAAEDFGAAGFAKAPLLAAVGLVELGADLAVSAGLAEAEAGAFMAVVAGLTAIAAVLMGAAI